MAPVGVLEPEEDESAREVLLGLLGSEMIVAVDVGLVPVAVARVSISSSVRLGKDSSLSLPSAATALKGLIWELEE